MAAKVYVATTAIEETECKIHGNTIQIFFVSPVTLVLRVGDPYVNSRESQHQESDDVRSYLP